MFSGSSAVCVERFGLCTDWNNCSKFLDSDKSSCAKISVHWKLYMICFKMSSYEPGLAHISVLHILRVCTDSARVCNKVYVSRLQPELKRKLIFTSSLTAD